MGANAMDALFYLVTTLVNIYLGALILRIILQWVRADFFNQMSQLIWKITQPVVSPLRNVVPRWRNLDTAALAVLLVLTWLFIQLMLWMWPGGAYVNFLLTLWWTLIKIVKLTIMIYTLSLLIQAVLSWMGPGVSNPAANILWSLNEPLLRPVRRIIPPIANLDLSPLVVMLVLQFINRLLRLPGIFG